jgi:hypothetical protein
MNHTIAFRHHDIVLKPNFRQSLVGSEPAKRVGFEQVLKMPKLQAKE